MKTIILSDYFEEHVEAYLKKFSKANYNKSGLNYEKSIFSGFEKVLGQENVKMFCCPTCGTFPNESKLFVYPKFTSKQPNIEYVKFNNTLYIRNIFRYVGLKKQLKKYLATLPKDEELLVLVIQMHQPFMKAFRYIKKKHPIVKSCINIWDYPNFVDFRNNNFLKKWLKSINYKKTLNMLKDYDLYFYLSEGMKKKNPNNKKYIVHEGIVSSEQIALYKEAVANQSTDGKFHIVYTGRLTKSDGILDLIDAVINLNDNSIILDIAGGGIEEPVISKAASIHNNIVFHGSLQRDEVVALQAKADLFVLARLPEEYTDYSFPSKMCEYILTGKPILTRPLKCFDDSLKKELFLFDDETNENLKLHLAHVIENVKNKKHLPDYSLFLNKNSNENITKEIIRFLRK